jgi:hypothetical protein
METMVGIAWPIALAAFTWVVVEFIARPVRNFFDLRREVRRRMLQFANVPVFKPTPGNEGLDAAHLFPGAKEPRDMFRDLGSQMRSFGETEHAATWVLTRFGLDPITAGKGLFGLSNTITKYGPERRAHRKNINTALRIKGDDE